MQRKIKIIIPMYNVEKYISKNIRILKEQEEKNFECYLIDDMSTDNTKHIVEKEIFDDDRFTLIENVRKKYALENIYDSIEYSKPSDEDILITIDGDDWLPHNKVLTKIREVYETGEVMMTYGSYVRFPSGEKSTLHKYPENIIANNMYREYGWLATHLRTFVYKLWKNINIEDLQDDDGNFYLMAWDLAFGFPMLEMAAGRIKFIEEVMYVYNRETPLNDDKIDKKKQISLGEKIRKKKKYSKLI